VEVDLTGTGIGATEADILVNGQEVASDVVVLRARHTEPKTVTVTIDEPVSSIAVRFENDGPGKNLFIKAIRVDGNPLDLTNGVVIQASNGSESEVTNPDEVALWFNSTYQLQHDAVTSGRPNRMFSSDSTFNWGGGETLAKVNGLLTTPSRQRELVFDESGRLVDDTPSDSSVIVIPAGLAEPVAEIEQSLAEAGHSMSNSDGGHVTIRLAAGEHRFEDHLTFKRGDVTIEGEGSGLTTVVHDFADGNRIEHAIEFHLASLNARFGFESNEEPPDPSELLSNITIRDFTITYAFDPGTDIVIDPSEGTIGREDLRELSAQNFVPKYAVANSARGNPGDVLSGHQAAIALDGVLEANIVDITAEWVGSHFLGIYESRGVYADGLVADGTLNRGGGGNGYALELVQSHDSVIKFDAVLDYRHISINNQKHSTVPDTEINWSTNNVIGVEYSNTNLDLHTLSEDGNILYAENLVASPYIQAQPVGENGEDGWNGQWQWSLRLDDERMAWDLFDPRETDNEKKGGLADENNDWFADNQIAAGRLNHSGEMVGGRDYQIVVEAHSNFVETLYASANDGYIYGGFDDDILHGGEGINRFVYADDPGDDVIRQFGAEDRIVIATGTLGIETVDDFMFIAGDTTPDPVSGNVVFQLGGQAVTIENVPFFSASAHVEILDVDFYDAENRDFTFFLG